MPFPGHRLVISGPNPKTNITFCFKAKPIKSLVNLMQTVNIKNNKRENFNSPI